MKRLVILVLVVVSISTPGHAGECRARGTTVYYANGMFNSYPDARKSLMAMKELGISSDIESESSRLRYDLAYNQDEAWWEELIQVARQKFGTDFTTFWKVMFDLLPMPDDMRKQYSLLLFKLGGSIYGKSDQDLRNHIELYKKDLADSRRVLVVSHSQGNFYALEAFSYLQQIILSRGERMEQSLLPLGIGNVQVAAPDSPEAWNFPWTTFRDDLVVKAVSELMGASPANLPSIGAGPPPERDPLGHDFVKAYLNTQESRDKIKQDILATAKVMRYPNWGTPGLSIDLETIKDTGLKLDVRQPNGSREGVLPDSGVQTGDRFHFESRCSQLQDGSYSLSVDTFDADTEKAPYSAVLAVRAGSEMHKYRVELKAGQNHDGLSAILNVQVKQRPDGAYIFRVKSRLREI